MCRAIDILGGMFATIVPWTIITIALFAALPAGRCTAQGLRLPEIERRYDAVVLVADVQTGRTLGGARLAEAADRRYAPGSLFKLAIGIAALRSGRFNRSFTYTCTGKDTIAGAVRRCWNGRGHATTGFRDAMANSCNLYFRHAAEFLTLGEIVQAARAVGMVPDANAGADRLFGITDENLLGDAFAVSPSQMMTVALSLASRGRLSPGNLSLFDAGFRPLYEGMRQCVTSGTGKNAWSRKFSMGGKTGTVEVPGMPGQTVGWFIGFAPFDEPRYAVVVMQRRARGAEAATLARKALEKLM